ncbi:MAG: NAD(P)H-hydrate dehydratase [Desulfosalsimonadaceae bacterium]
MIVVTADEMRTMDRQTIESFGLPGRILMENAGRGAARVLMQHFPELCRSSVAVAAGRGNNGGDGFVIARYLFQYGFDVKVYLLSESGKLSGDAATNFNLLGPLGVPVAEIPDESAFESLRSEMAQKSLWVDAILGTGLKSDVKGYFRTVIEFLNQLSQPVFAVDIPSGLHADTGRPCGTCIKANATATFAFAKTGHVQEPGASCTGALHVIDIGIPPLIDRQTDPHQHLLDLPYLQRSLPPRPADMHKGGAGHVLVAAGSPGKTGAAAMTATSAMRAGAGLVTLAVAKSLMDRVEPQVLEAMTTGLMENENQGLGEAAAEQVLKLLSDKNCLAVGPGIGEEPETCRVLHRLIQESPVPVVVDADGINNLAQEPQVLINTHAPVILTPHPGEMARLLGVTAADVQADRIGCARNFAESYSTYVILKGARTVIAKPDGRVYINPTGNPGMASGGMGDVLTGLVSGFLAQGLLTEQAACAAAFIHGAAADAVQAASGPFGYLASDVMEQVPKTIREVTSGDYDMGTPGSGIPIQEIL